MSKKSIQLHLKDIDFRTLKERQAVALPTMIDWYNELLERMEHDSSDQLIGQLNMLSAVLWHLMPRYEYRNLRRRKNTVQ